MTGIPVSGALPPSALQPYANARILLFSNAIPGVLDSERTGRFLFEGFIKRLRGISSKENAPGLDTGDFTYAGYLTRGAVLPLTPSQPWDWPLQPSTGAPVAFGRYRPQTRCCSPRVSGRCGWVRLLS